MGNFDVEFNLSFQGGVADAHIIDFYDVSQALVGFQRSIAITTHLVLNGTIITQAPALKGAEIYALPAEDGSWRISAGILLGAAGLYQLGTAPSNTPIGHLVYSAYDYVVSQSLGFHVDYNKSLGELYEEYHKKGISVPDKPRESQLDSAIEKCSNAMIELHRPIFKNGTAKTGKISALVLGQNLPLASTLSMESFHYLVEEHVEDVVEVLSGRISSYNSNTFKGRIYVTKEGRSVPFVLGEVARKEADIELVTQSLRSNALRAFDAEPIVVYCEANRVTSRSGRLKSYNILSISERPIE